MTPALTQKEFSMFRDLIYAESGISLNSSKMNLVQSRLQKRIREKNLNSFADYYTFVTTDPSRTEMIHMIDCISTNKTHFFREIKHFELLDKHILPELIKKKKENKDNKIRIWSAACSSGEEAYTLAMILYNHLENNKNIDAKILATDISTNVLNKAMKAVYNLEQIKETPENYTKKFFTPIYDGQEPLYSVKDDVKKLVTLRKLNLLELNASCNNRFDIIFCRNVMIYFDFETRQELINKYYNMLTIGGYLFLSHSETLSGKNHKFIFVQPAVYQK